MKISSFSETLLRIDQNTNGESKIFMVGTGLNLLSNLRQLTSHDLELVTAIGIKKDSDDLVKHLRSNNIISSGSYVSSSRNLGSYILYKKTILSGWEVVYNRWDTAWTDFINNIDIEKTFDRLKDSGIVHFDGITLCVSEKSRKVTLTLMKMLKEVGVEIAFDYNYRSTLISGEDTLEITSAYYEALTCSSYVTISAYDMNRVLGKELSSDFPLNEFNDKFDKIKYIYGYEKVVSDDTWEIQPFLITGDKLEQGEKIKYTPTDMLGQGDAFTAYILNDVIEGRVPDIGQASKWSVLKTKYVGDSTAPSLIEFNSWKNKKAIIR